MVSGKSAALSAMLPVLLAAVGCAEPRTPGRPTAVSANTPAPVSPRAGSVVVAGTHTTLADDGYVLNHAAISGDTLSVSVSYAGGCETHALTLVIAASFTESSPVQLPAALRHNANGDACEAWLTHSYAFDLAIVRTRYRAAYGPGSGRVALHLVGVAADPLVYEFTG